MSDLSFLERRTLEELFDMRSGYVLDFSNRTFQEFVADTVSRDIDDPKYNFESCSKANRLRKFWKVESNRTVGLLTLAMVEYAKVLLEPNVDEQLVIRARDVTQRLANSAPVPDIDVLAEIEDDRTFEALSRSVRESIENNKPEEGIDRLHTYVVRFLRRVCDERGISVSRDKPLHSMFGEYARVLHEEGLIDSRMSVEILRGCGRTLEAFNDVRNNKSLAHDNQMLDYDEALLIFSNVCSSIRFILALEEASNREEEVTMPPHDEIPF